jgi:sialidase-1
MKNTLSYFLVFILFCTAYSCSSKTKALAEKGVIVSAYSPVYPVLAGKKDNPVFRVNIVATSGEGLNLKEFTVALEDVAVATTIKTVAIYYTAAEEAFTTKHLFANTNNVSSEIQLAGDQQLATGDNFFWLAIELKDGADLDGKVLTAITDLKTNSGKVVVPLVGENEPKRFGIALRQHKDDGVDTYRIPGLATSNSGTLLAVYDIRHAQSGDLQEDIDVGLNRSTDGGKTWEPMKTIIDMGEWGGLPEAENGVGDPSILVDRQTGTIWVAALWIHGHAGERAWFASQQGLSPQETGQFVLVKSEDDGLTWSAPINITAQIKDSGWYLLLDGPGKGIALEDGTLVFPAQFKDAEQVPHATLVTSKDHGETWAIGSGAKSHTTEAQVVELSDHSLMLNMRDDRGSGPKGRNGTGARSVMTTADLGQTWKKHPTSRGTLPEPVCMASLISHTFQEDRLLLFSNPFDQFVRKNMTVKASTDDGLTWSEKYFTLIDEGRGRGYSCLTTIDENTVGILYEGSQADLVFQRLSLKEIMSK